MINEFEYKPTYVPDVIKNPIDKQKYFVYNVSKGQANYSQLMSKYSYSHGLYKTNGYSFCNVTMIAMALIYLGYQDKYLNIINKKYPELNRLPDKLAKHCLEDSGVLAYFKRNYPSLYEDFASGDKENKNVIAPNELHNSLSYATNDFFGIGTITYFSTNVSWVEIINDLVFNNRPVGISGKFSGLNHIVLAVGAAYKYLGDNTKPTFTQKPDYILVDDPFGKTYEYDKHLSGNDIWIPFEKCIEDFKSLGNEKFKYAHRFLKPDDIG